MRVARWETRGKRYWYNVIEHDDGTATYESDNGFGSRDSFDLAVLDVEAFVILAKQIDDISYTRVHKLTATAGSLRKGDRIGRATVRYSTLSDAGVAYLVYIEGVVMHRR